MSAAPLRVRPAPRSTPRPTASIGPVVAPLPTPSGHSPGYVQDALGSDFAADGVDFGYRPTPRHELPEPTAWAAHIARAVTEVMQGLRAPTQLLRWTSTEVYEVVARRGGVAARRRAAERARGQALAARPMRVRRVLTCLPTPEVVEATVVLEDGPRVRAMALRLSGRDGRWVLTALQTG